jgi:hypothetical protein
MADRYPSFFGPVLPQRTDAPGYPSFYGPVLPQRTDAPEANTAEELVHIQALRIEVDVVRAANPAWPAERRFETMIPVAPRPPHADGAPGGEESRPASVRHS